MTLIISSVDCLGVSGSSASLLINTPEIYPNTIIQVAQYDSGSGIISSWSGVSSLSSTAQTISINANELTRYLKFRLYDQSCSGIFSNTVNFNQYANWNGSESLSPSGNVTTVGSNGPPSFYNTYDQNGQVYEWNDLDATENIYKGLRGGSYASIDVDLQAATRPTLPEALYEGVEVGFRVASNTNPSGYSNFVSVGDSNNTADDTGYGAVSSDFMISEHLTTNCGYVYFLNCVAQDNDSYGLYNESMNTDSRGGISKTETSVQIADDLFQIIRQYSCKTNMCDKPVNYVSWFDAARYCNWLHNGRPSGSSNNSTEDGAYTLNGTTTGPAPAKNVSGNYYLPTENQWYKAAYYKGGGTDAGYWTYATRSNSTPFSILADAVGNGPSGTGMYSCSSETTPVLVGCGLTTWEPTGCIELPEGNYCIYDDGKLPDPPPSATGTYYASSKILLDFDVNKSIYHEPEDSVPYFWNGVHMELDYTGSNWIVSSVNGMPTGITMSGDYTPFSYSGLLGLTMTLTTFDYNGTQKTIFNIDNDLESPYGLDLSIEIPLRYRAFYNDYTVSEGYTLPVFSDTDSDQYLLGVTSGVCYYDPSVTFPSGSYPYNVGSISVTMVNSCRSPAYEACVSPPGPECPTFTALPPGLDIQNVNNQGRYGRPIDIDVNCDGTIRPVDSDFADLSPSSYQFYFASAGRGAVPVIDDKFHDTTWLDPKIVPIHSEPTPAALRDWVCDHLRFVSLTDYADYVADSGNEASYHGFICLSNDSGVASSGCFALKNSWPYNDLYWEQGRCSGLPPGEIPVNLVPC
jgi:formylglycine-generating enzyme required for sulfatase activity